MNRDIIGTLELGDTEHFSGSSGGVCIGLSGSGSGIGSLKCSMDENPQWWCWLHRRGSRAFPKGRLLGWNFGGEGGHGGSWIMGNSDPGCGVDTCGVTGHMTDGGAGGRIGDGGTGALADGAIVVGWLDEDEDGNGPNDKCVDGICLRPHADFLLGSLAAFRSVLSLVTKSWSLSIFPYLD